MLYRKIGLLILLLMSISGAASCAGHDVDPTPLVAKTTQAPAPSFSPQLTLEPSATNTPPATATATMVAAATSSPTLAPSPGTPTVTQPVWFSRPDFPEDAPVFARVLSPATTRMYGSLDDAVALSQTNYKFAYDVVYIQLLDSLEVDGVGYVNVLFDGHERWMRAEDISVASISQFTGIVLREGIDQFLENDYIGIVLTDTVSSAGAQYSRGDVLMLLAVDTNAGAVSGSGTASLPLNQVATFALHLERQDVRYPCRRIVVDVSSNSLAVYDENCLLRFATLISTGILPGSTPAGLYRIASKEAQHTFRAPPEIRQTLENYIFENVPYTMIFSGYYALHSVYWHDAFGSSTSHGCINLSLADAKWLFGWAEEQDWLFIQW